MKIFILCVLCIVPALQSVAADSDCPINGPKIQWLVDYCMYKIGTDDIIAADPCMKEDEKINYRNDCDAKIKYKKEMCNLAIGSGWVKKSRDACFADPEFMGGTVRNGGVGG